MADIFDNNTEATATKMGTLAFPNSTFNGPSNTNFFRLESLDGTFIRSGGTDRFDFFTFDPYKLESVTVKFDAGSVGDYLSFLRFMPVSGVSRVEGDIAASWYNGIYDTSVDGTAPDGTLIGLSVQAEASLDVVRKFAVAGDVYNFNGVAATTSSDLEFDATATWYLTGEPVVIFATGFHGTASEFGVRPTTSVPFNYDFSISPKTGLVDIPLTFEQLFAANASAASGLATAYHVLLGGVPNQAGFMSLLNGAISTNFGAGLGPTFNQENIFINLINNLVQGNTDARAKFNELAIGADLAAKVTTLYKTIVPPSKQSDEGLAFITRPEGLAFYQSVAAERGVAGTDGASIVALASILNIAVTNDFGIGNSVNDLIKAVAASSSAVPLSGSVLTDIEIADGVAFDGDDAAALARLVELPEASVKAYRSNADFYSATVEIVGVNSVEDTFN